MSLFIPAVWQEHAKSCQPCFLKSWGSTALKQNALLDQLHAQGKRIEALSKLEHDLIKEVQPQVGEIKEGMDAMVAAVKENGNNNAPASTNK